MSRKPWVRYAWVSMGVGAFILAATLVAAYIMLLKKDYHGLLRVLLQLGLAVVLIVNGVAARRFCVSMKLMGEGRCIKCGYDLRGSENRCPECGQPFPDRVTSGGTEREQKTGTALDYRNK